MCIGGKRKRDTLEQLQHSVAKWEGLAEQRKVHQAHARRLGKEMKELEGVLANEMIGLGLTELQVNETQVFTLESCVRLN